MRQVGGGGGVGIKTKLCGTGRKREDLIRIVSRISHSFENLKNIEWSHCSLYITNQYIDNKNEKCDISLKKIAQLLCILLLLI
jgi:hypothetical protein